MAEVLKNLSDNSIKVPDSLLHIYVPYNGLIESIVLGSWKLPVNCPEIDECHRRVAVNDQCGCGRNLLRRNHFFLHVFPSVLSEYRIKYCILPIKMGSLRNPRITFSRRGLCCTTKELITPGVSQLLWSTNKYFTLSLVSYTVSAVPA